MLHTHLNQQTSNKNIIENTENIMVSFRIIMNITLHSVVLPYLHNDFINT